MNPESLPARRPADDGPAYLHGLNPAQRNAVEAGDGPLLVLSGAGTGKTRVLTARVAHLLATGRTSPGGTLVVTFTNRAAREMRERVEGLTGLQAGGWWLGTFHALGARILRRHAEQAGLRDDFAILDADDQLRVLRQIVSGAGIDPARWTPKNLRHFIERWKNLGLAPGRADEEGADFADGRGHALYAAYQERLRELNAADFGDLLLHNLTLFRDAETLRAWQERFRHILVDEYQDTNTAQYLWLRLLAGGHGNLCVVGDEDQSIYAWRGADIGNILRFEKDFPAATVVRLEQNYRSTGHILGAASALIAKNTARLGKTLWTADGEGAPVLVRGVRDGEQEAHAVADDIEALRDSGTDLGEVAVLVRTTALTRGFEERFLQIGLPYRIVGGVRFYERLEIRDALAYLRLVRRRGDDLALERVVNRPKRGVGATTLRRIAERARGERTSLEDATRGLLDAGAVRGRAGPALGTFLDGLGAWRERAQSLPPQELARTVLEESGYLEMWRNDRTPEAAGRVENLEELVNAIGEFPNLGGFLDHVALVQEIDGGSGEGRVSLMTLHAAKGLEFEVVFLPGWEDGLFPHELALRDGGSAGLEEERRLAYVGLTRARREARISSAARRMHRGLWRDQFPSMFLAELPEEHVEVEALADGAASPGRDVVRPAIGDRRSSYHRYTDRAGVIDVTPRPVRPESSGADYEDGARVFHQKFGYGSVVSVDGNALEVDFETSGRKKILCDYVEPAPAS